MRTVSLNSDNRTRRPATTPDAAEQKVERELGRWQYGSRRGMIIVTGCCFVAAVTGGVSCQIERSKKVAAKREEEYWKARREIVSDPEHFRVLPDAHNEYFHLGQIGLKKYREDAPELVDAADRDLLCFHIDCPISPDQLEQFVNVRTDLFIVLKMAPEDQTVLTNIAKNLPRHSRLRYDQTGQVYTRNNPQGIRKKLR